MLHDKRVHGDVMKWNHFRVTGLCEGNPLATDGSPSQRPVMFSLMYKRLNKQWGWRWFKTPWCPCKLIVMIPKTNCITVIPPVVKTHDDFIKWTHFSRYWPFVRGIHRSPVNSSHKGQWRGALMFLRYEPWINDWVNNREAGDFRRQRAHYDIIAMKWCEFSHHCARRYPSTWQRHEINRHSADYKFKIFSDSHWGRDKIATISQTTFSNAFSWMEMYDFRLRFHWNLFLRFELTIIQH